MIFKKTKEIVLGKVEKELVLQKSFGSLKWRWKRRWLFNKICINVRSALNPHIMIIGESGSGKSNACKQILSQLARSGYRFIVLDPHSEYVENSRNLGATVYDAGRSGANIFDLDGLSERERTSEITGMFRRIFRLGEVQAYTLYKCIAYTYGVCARKGRTPTLHDLLYTFRVFARHAERSESSILETLEKRLLLVVGDSPTRGVSVSRLLRERSIFSLSSLHTSEAQAIYMEGMLKKIYTLMLNGDGCDRGRFYIVIDEAEKLQNSPVIARLVAEGRKYGVGVIAISQRAKALDKEIRSNAATIIAFSQHEPEEQNYVANLISGGNEYNRFMEIRKALRELGRGRALMAEAPARSPKVVRCALFDPASKDPSYRIMMLTEKAASLQELLQKLGREGFSEENVLNSLDALETQGIVKRHDVDDPCYRGTWYISMPRNSAEHDIMVNLISRHLGKLGVRNFIHNKAYGPDVIAYFEGRNIAIEYETGKKDPESTAKMLEGRKGKYSNIVLITSKEVLCTPSLVNSAVMEKSSPVEEQIDNHA
jgi:hypothetical protein